MTSIDFSCDSDCNCSSNDDWLEQDRPIVILIGGNRRAGKNTFASVLSQKEQTKAIKFNVFTNDIKSRDLFSDLPFNYNECSFAQILKENLAEKIAISLEEVELLKDQPMSQEMLANYGSDWFQIPETDQPTIRDALIDTAARKLKENQNYYAEQLYQSKILPKIKEKSVFLVTDWRYKAEYFYFKRLAVNAIIDLYTIRIINQNAPDLQVPSERDLDDDFNHDPNTIKDRVLDAILPFFITMPVEQSPEKIQIYKGGHYNYITTIG